MILSVSHGCAPVGCYSSFCCNSHASIQVSLTATRLLLLARTFVYSLTSSQITIHHRICVSQSNCGCFPFSLARIAHSLNQWTLTSRFVRADSRKRLD